MLRRRSRRPRRSAPMPEVTIFPLQLGRAGYTLLRPSLEDASAPNHILIIGRLAMRRALRSFFPVIATGFCSLAFALTLLSIVMLLLTGMEAGQRDFVSFWVAGQRTL